MARRTITIDAWRRVTVELNGDTLALDVKRMNPFEAREFRRRMLQIGQFPSQSLIARRRPDEMDKTPIARPLTALELALRQAVEAVDDRGPVEDALLAAVLVAARRVTAEPEGDTFVIPMADIHLRRLAEMTPEQRAQYDALDADEERAAIAATVEAIQAYVRVPAGELAYRDSDGIEREAQTGADLVAIFGRDETALARLYAAILRANLLSDDEKKDSRLPSDSVGSFETHGQPARAHGDGPGIVATRAALRDSAVSETATASNDARPMVTA